MLEVKNVKVYDLEESIIACRNAMRTELPEYTKEEFEKSLERAVKLASTATDSGHQTFLSGIRVSFDLIYPNYISPELQRYHWVDIVTSSSKMHKLAKMDIRKCCNKYVSPVILDEVSKLQKEYNDNPSYENFMRLVSSCPQGIELFMRISTNYLQLKTIYYQRKNHKLKDWHNFIAFIEKLPYALELIVGADKNTYKFAEEIDGYLDY